MPRCQVRLTGMALPGQRRTQAWHSSQIRGIPKSRGCPQHERHLCRDHGEATAGAGLGREQLAVDPHLAEAGLHPVVVHGGDPLRRMGSSREALRPRWPPPACEVMSMISALVLRAVCSPTGPGSVWVGSHFCSTTHTITFEAGRLVGVLGERVALVVGGEADGAHADSTGPAADPVGPLVGGSRDRRPSRRSAGPLGVLHGPHEPWPHRHQRLPQLGQRPHHGRAEVVVERMQRLLVEGLLGGLLVAAHARMGHEVHRDLHRWPVRPPDTGRLVAPPQDCRA